MGLDSQILRQRLFTEYKNIPRYGEKYYLMLSYPVLKSQLATYLVQARTANPKLATVVKGDRDADYGVAEDVIDILQKTQITRFNLVTDLARQIQE